MNGMLINYGCKSLINKFEIVNEVVLYPKRIWNHFWSYLNPPKQDMSSLLFDEIWVKIMEELNPCEIIQLSMVSSRLQKVGRNPILWEKKAILEKLFVQPGLKAIDEWKVFLIAESMEKNSLLMSQMAKAIGPTFMGQLRIRKETKGEGEKGAVFLYRSQREAYHFRCKENECGRAVIISLLETDNPDQVLISYKRFGPVLKDKGISLKVDNGSHLTIFKSQSVFDYLTRLVAGQTCGLLGNNEEDKRFSLQLMA